jgi:UDP-glucuronate 4-epimerase
MPRTPTLLGGGGGGGAGLGGVLGGGGSSRSGGGLFRLKLSSPLCIAAVMSVTFFVYVFSSSSSSSASHQHHNHNHHRLQQQQQQQQQQNSRRFGGGASEHHHRHHHRDEVDDFEDDDELHDDAHSSRNSYHRNHHQEEEEEGGGKSNTILGGERTKKKGSGAGSSLPKSSVSYPKAKKDSASLIAQSCNGGNSNDDNNNNNNSEGEDQPKVFLVTGTAGFVGYHVATKLKERGDYVVGLDVVNDYYPQGLKRARLKELNRAGVHTVEADLNDQETLAEMFSLCTFTHVLHLAAQAGVRYAAKNPHAYVHSNVAGFVSLMEVAVRQRPFIPRVIFASSSSVYGLNTKVPFSETDMTDSPASLYAATKKSDELLAHTYNAIHGVAVTALRFFTVYGPLGRPDMAYFSFANNIVKGKPIKIFTGPGGSELARDFTYIDDVARGVIASCDTSEPSNTPSEKTAGKKKPKFRVYNLGNTHPVTVSDFVSTLEKHLGKEAIREYVPMPKTGDVPFTHADVSAARRDLGYEPRVSLDEGLKKFVDWYTSYYVDGKHSEDQNYVPN